jgi:tetratricopeptide (TPR) repeat protein
MTYGLVVLYVTSGQGDEHLGAEWIHKAYRFSQLSRHDNPLLAFVIPLERLLQAPEEAVTAFESLLDSVDPWVRAMARWQVAKMRTMLGQGGREVETQLELALAEFRTLGERFGISLALSELAGQLAMRGEFAGACEYYEQAIAVLTEVGAVEDVIEARTQQAMLYRLDGDRDASAASIAEAERSAEGVTWPYALVALALAKAGLARLDGDAEEARRQLGLATTLLGDAAEQANIRAQIHNLHGYLADDLREARTHRVAAWQAASELGHSFVMAPILVGFADLAVRLDHYEQAARLLAASVAARGLADLSQSDAARIERDARRHLGEARFAEVTQEGRQTSWSQLIEDTLAS